MMGCWRGLFWGVDLVADRDSKVAFDPILKIAPKIKKAVLGHGLMCYPMQGTIDGQHGDHVLLAPPFTMNETQVDEMVETLKMAILEVLVEGP